MFKWRVRRTARTSSDPAPKPSLSVPGRSRSTRAPAATYGVARTVSSPRRFGRSAQAAAVVPIAMLSAAWTIHLSGPPVGLPGLAVAASGPLAGTYVPQAQPRFTVPESTIEAPASLSQTDEVQTAGDGRFRPVSSESSTGDIPSSALVAYQRAETIINAADPGCHLSWQLLAAVGRVESDHGRFGGSSIGADGVVVPGILGPPLDGHSGTAAIADTDAGQYDGDSRYDRAVGPMQFIPSTWAVVGVDADNDGVRNPQDIDDAALAAAVYLCSGDEDLGSTPEQYAAVYRYNHSDSYVTTVLSIMASYVAGDYDSTPSDASTVSAGSLVPVGPLYPVGPSEPFGPFASDGLGPRVDAASLFGLREDRADALSMPPVHEPPTTPDAPDTTDPTAPTVPTDGRRPDGRSRRTIPRATRPTRRPTRRPTPRPVTRPTRRRWSDRLPDRLSDR